MKPNDMLWKSTIVIITDYDPRKLELDHLAREACVGDAICVSCEAERVKFAEVEADVGDFFSFGDDECDDECDD